MKLESNYLQVFVNAVTGFWGGLLLAIISAFFYGFYCMLIMAIFVSEDTGHHYGRVIHFMDIGCFEFLMLLLLVIYCFKFAKNNESRVSDMCIACMVIALDVFISYCDMSVSMWRVAGYLIISLATPLVMLWAISAIRRRQVRLLEQQADEMERQRTLGGCIEHSKETPAS